MVELDAVHCLEVDWRSLEGCKRVDLDWAAMIDPCLERVQVVEEGRMSALLEEVG